MRRNQGSVLILTMVVLAALAATLAALAASQNVAAKEAINRSEQAEARQAYMDGIQNGLSILSQIVEPGGQSNSANSLTATNLSSGGSNNTTGATMLTDDWATEGTNGDVLYRVGGHSFRMQIVDACSLLNINSTATSGTTAQINQLCNTAGATITATGPQPLGCSDTVLNQLPFQPQEIEAIEDYRSSSTTAQALGAKDSYYQGLQNPYNAKLLPFETFDELLQVQGLTAKLLYFPRTDVTTATNPLVDVNGNNEALSQVLTAYALSPQLRPDNGQAKINVNTITNGAGGNTLSRTPLASMPAIVTARGAGWTSLRQLITTVGNNNSTNIQNLLNYAYIPQAGVSATTTTPTASCLVNINTASASVLEQLPGMTTDIATAIVNQQSQGFLHLGDIMSVSGITAANIAQFADQITATSETFLVRVIGIAGSTSIPVEAVVNVVNDTPQIISIQEQPFSAKEMINRWTWDNDTTTETVLKDNS